MENASKALIMAGAVLIAILIISLGVLIFKNMSNSVVNDSSLQKEEISSFNSKLSPYLGKNKSGSQVKEMIQKAVSINQDAKNREDPLRRVTVQLNGTDIVSFAQGSKDVKYDGDYIRKNLPTNTYYEVTSKYNDDTGLIDTLYIKTNK